MMDPPRLLGYVCLGCNVTTDIFWHILMRLVFGHANGLSFLFPILSSYPV